METNNTTLGVEILKFPIATLLVRGCYETSVKVTEKQRTNQRKLYVVVYITFSRTPLLSLKGKCDTNNFAM